MKTTYKAEVVKVRLVVAGLALAWLAVAAAGLIGLAADANGMTISTWSIRLILDHPFVSLALSTLLVALAIAPAHWLVLFFPVVTPALG